MVGGKYREYVVRLDPAQMLAHDLTPDDVVSRARQGQRDRIRRPHDRFASDAADRGHREHLRSREQLAAVPIANVDGQPVMCATSAPSNSASARTTSAPPPRTAPRCWSESRASPAATPSTFPSQAHAADERASAALSRRATFRFPTIRRRWSAESFNSVRDAIVLGLVLSVLVVLRLHAAVSLSALVAAIVVPCTIAITFVVMKAFGMTFNMMTLGGLAAGIGLFIDDAIVMIEAIHRARAAGIAAEEGVPAALRELRAAADRLDHDGDGGVRAADFALGRDRDVLSRARDHARRGLVRFRCCWRSISRRRSKSRSNGCAAGAARPGRIFTAIRDGYLAAMPAVRALARAGDCARGRSQSAAPTVCIAHLGTDYLPALDEGAFILDYITPPQSTLDDTQAMLAQNRSHSQGHARGRGVFAPHRHPARILSDRIESRRYLGAAQSQSHARYRCDHGSMCARKILSYRARRARRVLAGPPGSDRRSLGHAGADRGQGLRLRSGDDRDHRAPASPTSCAKFPAWSTSSTASC